MNVNQHIFAVVREQINPFMDMKRALKSAETSGMLCTVLVLITVEFYEVPQRLFRLW